MKQTIIKKFDRLFYSIKIPLKLKRNDVMERVKIIFANQFFKALYTKIPFCNYFKNMIDL